MTTTKYSVRRTAWRLLRQYALPHYALNVFNLCDGKPAYLPIQPRLDTLKTKANLMLTRLDALPSGGHIAVALKDVALGELYAALESVAVGLEDNATTELYVIEAGTEP